MRRSDGGPDRFQRVALERARLHLDEGDQPPALHDQVDLAERRLVAAGDRPKALGEKEEHGGGFGDMAVAIGRAAVARACSHRQPSAFSSSAR